VAEAEPGAQSAPSLPTLRRLLAGAGRRPAAVVVLGMLLSIQVLLDERDAWPVRRAVFDIYQQWFPREVERFPVRVIDVDEASLAALGQWPWPRFRLARLIEKTTALGALAVGLDILMLEPDRLSPSALAESHPDLPESLREALRGVPTNDTVLAATLSRQPAVVARMARNRGSPATGPVRYPPTMTQGSDPLPWLTRFSHLQLNVPELEAAAAGHGLVNSIFDDDGVVRRVPVLARVGEDVAPSMPLEVLRVALGAPFLTVQTNDQGIQGVGMADAFVPTAPDGTLRLHFAPSNPQRRVSALAVLSGRLPPNHLEGQVAIIGVTAVGTADAPPTPISGRMDGVEIQAQVLESLLEGVRLVRPDRALLMEIAALLLAGASLVAWLPALGARRGLVLIAGTLMVLGIAGVVAFAQWRWLLDPSYAMISTVLLGLLMLASLLAEAARQARLLDAQLEQQRLATARLAGELGAAREIQMGILPAPDEIEGLPASVTLDARLEPARAVGGDLYDAFMVDEDRLFFLVGDVSGKGIPASLFMALSKALCKSIVRRTGGPMAGRISLANEEISNENPKLLFVTVLAGVLDTRTGDLELCVAGHDAPCLIRPGEAPDDVPCTGGPPLCVLEDFPYPTDAFRLEPGDTLLLTTDGVAEAQNPMEELYGRERMIALVAGIDPESGPKVFVEALYRDVEQFAAGREPADDVTIMAIHFDPR
jgi:serine phosphatase RsbU (regulator of sigma subunit)